MTICYNESGAPPSLLFGVLGPSTARKIIGYRISSDCRFLLRLGLDRRFGSSTTVGVLYTDSSAGGRGPLLGIEDHPRSIPPSVGRIPLTDTVRDGLQGHLLSPLSSSHRM